jgi:glycosyltransferase involved in cell wall biosynthesis
VQTDNFNPYFAPNDTLPLPTTNIQQDLVSIITPAYHAHTVIHRAVQSVINQTYTQWEMLIVGDDGRNYKHMLKQHGIDDPRLRFLQSDRIQSGPNITRNIALAQAKGQFIAPLDADDLYYPQRLEKLVPLAKSHGMSADNALVVDDQSNKLYGTVFPENDTIHWLDLRSYAQTSTPLIFVFNTAIIKHWWEEDIQFGADTIFNLRAMEICGRVPLYQKSLHEYRIKNGSICHSPNSFKRAENAYDYSLQQIEKNRLGFSEQNAPIVKTMLKRKRAQNRAFQNSLQSGECQSFEEFMTTRNSDIRFLYNDHTKQEKTLCNQR